MKVNSRLHWTTTLTEKGMLAFIGMLTVVAAGSAVWDMWIAKNIQLADLFLLFIYTEIVGMVGAYFISNKSCVFRNQNYFYIISYDKWLKNNWLYS